MTEIYFYTLTIPWLEYRSNKDVLKKMRIERTVILKSEETVEIIKLEDMENLIFTGNIDGRRCKGK